MAKVSMYRNNTTSTILITALKLVIEGKNDPINSVVTISDEVAESSWDLQRLLNTPIAPGSKIMRLEKVDTEKATQNLREALNNKVSEPSEIKIEEYDASKLVEVTCMAMENGIPCDMKVMVKENNEEEPPLCKYHIELIDQLEFKDGEWIRKT